MKVVNLGGPPQKFVVQFKHSGCWHEYGGRMYTFATRAAAQKVLKRAKRMDDEMYGRKTAYRIRTSK